MRLAGKLPIKMDEIPSLDIISPFLEIILIEGALFYWCRKLDIKNRF